MPTENRSSNTEMVSVPRELLQDLYEAAQFEADQRRSVLGNFRPHVQEALDKIAADAKSLLDAPAQQHQGEPVEWSTAKPTTAGAFWVRGNGLEQDALVQVIDDDGELRCNLHRPTTETDFGYGYAIADLSDDFEWLGPLSASAEPSAPVERGPWQPLSAPGQVQDGDWLSFTVAGRFICAQARLVIDPGTDKEEVVYNRQKNYYFVTSMAVDGSSTHKGVRVAKAKS